MDSPCRVRPVPQDYSSAHGLKMKYRISAKQTEYKGVVFRSRLEARYAAFFDVIGWEWQYEPVDLSDWSPDFYVRFPCGHSECDGYHDLLIEVKPYVNQEQFDGHPCSRYDETWSGHPEFPTSGVAGFGLEPWKSTWSMAHGSGGGTEEIGNWISRDSGLPDWEDGVRRAWCMAGNIVQWRFNSEGKRTR